MRALLICLLFACALAASDADARQGRSRPGTGPNSYSTGEQARILSYQAALNEARRYNPGYREPAMASRRGVPSLETIERIRRDAAHWRALAQPYLTEPPARARALAMGFRPTGYVSAGAMVYQRGREYIARDTSGHPTGRGVGVWKRGYDWRALGRRGARLGTYNRDLSVRMGP